MNKLCKDFLVWRSVSDFLTGFHSICQNQNIITSKMIIFTKKRQLVFKSKNGFCGCFECYLEVISTTAAVLEIKAEIVELGILRNNASKRENIGTT